MNSLILNLRHNFLVAYFFFSGGSGEGSLIYCHRIYFVNFIAVQAKAEESKLLRRTLILFIL